MTATGLVAAPRQLVVTTHRILVLRDGSVERSVAMASINGAHMKEPSEWPLEDSERAVLVHSGGKEPTVWGCWSMATEEAERLMAEIFKLSHVAKPGGIRSRWPFLRRGRREAEKTFEGDGYSFIYPGEWNERPFSLGVEEGPAVSMVALAPEGHDVGMLLGVYQLSDHITERNIVHFADEAAEDAKESFQGRISNGPTLATVSGRPAFHLELSFENPDGQPLQSRMVFVFDGTTEYFFNFQFTHERAEEMKRACERVVDSFRID